MQLLAGTVAVRLSLPDLEPLPVRRRLLVESRDRLRDRGL